MLLRMSAAVPGRLVSCAAAEGSWRESERDERVYDSAAGMRL